MPTYSYTGQIVGVNGVTGWAPGYSFSISFSQDPNTGVCSNLQASGTFTSEAWPWPVDQTNNSLHDFAIRISINEFGWSPNQFGNDLYAFGYYGSSTSPASSISAATKSHSASSYSGWKYTPNNYELTNGKLPIHITMSATASGSMTSLGANHGYGMKVELEHFFTPPDSTPPTTNISLTSAETPVGSYYTTTDSSAKIRIQISDSGSGPKEFKYSVSKYEMGADGLSIGALDSSTGFSTHNGDHLDIALDPNFLVAVEVKDATDHNNNIDSATYTSHTYTVALPTINVTNAPTPAPTAVSGCVDLWEAGYPTDGIITASQLATNSKILNAYESVWGTDHTHGVAAGYANNLEWALDWYNWITSIPKTNTALHTPGSTETAASNPGGGPKTIADCFSTPPSSWNRSGGSSGWYSGLFARGQEGSAQYMAGWFGTKAAGQFFPNSVAFHLHRYGIYWGYSRYGGQWGSGHIRNTGRASVTKNCHRRRDAWITQCIIAWQAGWKYPPYNSGTYSGEPNGWAGSTSTPSDPGYNDQPCGIDEMFINLGITLDSPGNFKIDDCIPPTINAVNIRSLNVPAAGNFYYADYPNTGVTCSFEVDATDEQYGLANAHYKDTDTNTTYIENFTSNIYNETIGLPISILDGSGNPRTHIPIEVTVYDAAGNPSAPVTNTVHIDIGLPQISIDPTNSRNMSGRTGRGSGAEAGSSPTDQWVGPNKTYTIGAFDVVDTLTGIKEYSLEYSTSSTAPTPTFVPVNSPITFNQIETVVLDDESTTSTLVTPSTLSLPGGLSDGDPVYLHMHVKDLADNESLPATREYHYDSDLPQFANVYFNSSQTQVSGSTLAVFGEVWDETSGVTYFEFHDGYITEPTKVSTSPHPIFDSSFELNDNFKDTNKLYIENNPNNPNNSDYPISTTAGARQVSIIAMDQSDNYTVQHWSFTHSGCDITWSSASLARAVNCPFLVEGSFKATISGCSSLIAGFAVSYDLSNPPAHSNFSSVGKYQTYEPPNSDISSVIYENNISQGVIHLLIEDPSGNFSYASKYVSFAPVDYSSMVVGNPTLEIKHPLNRIYTNQATNNFDIKLEGGSISSGGNDVIIAYAISTSSTPPSGEPTFNSTTQKFQSGGSNWVLLANPQVNVVRNESFTIGGGFGSTTIYLHAFTLGYSGKFSSRPKQIFTSSYTMQYVNDFDGPSLSAVTVNTNPTTQSGTTYTSTIDSTSTTGNIVRVNIHDATGIERWEISETSTPASSMFSSRWNVVSGIQTNIYGVSNSLQVNASNGIKTVYVHAIDIVGNISKHLVKFPLNDPTLSIPTQGINSVGAGISYKMEGNPTEHATRKSILSMFGEGKIHQGFISRNLTDVTIGGQFVRGIKSLRIHNLKNYQGMPVTNVATGVDETLPSVNLKISDFIGKRPRIKNTKINCGNSAGTTPNTGNIFEGDSRTFTLLVDIENGIASNTNLIDIHAHWTITGPGVSGVMSGISNGIVSYTFSQPGTYVITAINSFGISAVGVYIVWPVTIPPTIPPPQAPFSPIDITVNTNGGVGVTPVTLPDITLDSLSPAVDIAFVVDGSGSYYTPGANCFARTLGNNITSILNEADKIAQDVVTGDKHSRYAMISFGADPISGSWPTYNIDPAGEAIDLNWTTSQSSMGTACSSPNKTGGLEAKIRGVMTAANGLQWKPISAKIICLFADEKDSGMTSTDTPQLSVYQSTSTYNYANKTQTGSGATGYFNKTSDLHYAHQLKKKEIGFVCFDAGQNGASTADDLVYSTGYTKEFGGVMSEMKLADDGATMATRMKEVYKNLANNTTISFESASDNPNFFAVTNSINPITGQMEEFVQVTNRDGVGHPAKFSDLATVVKPYGDRRIARFDVNLDNSQIENFRQYSNGVALPLTIVAQGVIRNSAGTPMWTIQFNINVP